MKNKIIKIIDMTSEATKKIEVEIKGVKYEGILFMKK